MDAFAQLRKGIGNNMENERKITSWISQHEITIAIIGAIATFIWTAHSFDARMLAQEQRIDKLYEMFVEIVKQRPN